jgi:aromatic amino acid transport protein AroP
MPGEAFGLLMGLAVSALVINWAMISWSHLRFRSHKAAAGTTTLFRSPAYPLSNYLCLAFLAGIVAVMFLTPELRTSVYLIPAWLALLVIGFWLRRRSAAPPAAVPASADRSR